MNWAMLFCLFILILFFFLLSGQKVAFSLGITGLAGLFMVGDFKGLQSIGLVIWNSINTFELTAIPLFMLMGEIVVLCGLSDNFYKSATVWFSRLPGGFLQTNIFSCAIFAAISGSSLATAASIGSVAYPELTKMGYDKKMVIGTLSGGGALGILIPPSVPLLIYGSMVSESVAKLFIAGIIPGIIATLIFMIYTGIRAKLNPKLVPVTDQKATVREKLGSIKGMLPFMILIFAVLGTIYMGIATPTEATGISVAVSVIMALLYRTFSIKDFISACINSVKSSAMIFFIVIGAQFLSFLLVKSGVSRELTEWFVGLNPSKAMTFVMVIVIYFILGTLMDGTSIIYLTIPVLYPLVEFVGFDPIWFGIVMVIMIEIAMLTPPVGMNLFVLHGITRGDVGFNEIIAGSAPYILLYFSMIIILLLFPQTATWLPSTM
jgi:tripartite ATP-independent transporter DctM subunit